MSASHAVSHSAGRCLSIAASLLVAHLVAFAPGTALAQTARSGGSASTQLIQQMQQLASERTTLQAENERLEKALADMTKERDSLKAGRDALDRRSRSTEMAAARSAEEKAAADAENEKLKARMQELIGKFRETAQTLKDVETERAAFKDSLNTRDRELAACTAKNDALYQLNGEVLTRMEHQGFWSKMAQAEPFTRLKRVQLENLVDDYKYRADEQRVQSGSARGASSPAAADTAQASPR